jgi:hypothetical protein
MENQYYKFGINKPVAPNVSDPVDCCIGNKYMNCPENPLRYDNLMCNNFMIQRCAKNWDEKCSQYLSESMQPYLPKNLDSLPPAEILEEIARTKYCMLDKSDPNAKCVELCEPLNPLDQTSASVCSIYGTEIYEDDSYLKDIAGDFPATAKLRNTSRVRIGKCPIICKGVDKIEENDPVINMCLTTGKCSDVMQQLAQYALKNNVPVKNEKFKKFMEYYTSLSPSQQEALITAKPDLIVPQKFSNDNVSTFVPPTDFNGISVDHNYIHTVPNHITTPSKYSFDLVGMLNNNKCIISLILLIVVGCILFLCKKKKQQ